MNIGRALLCMLSLCVLLIAFILLFIGFKATRSEQAKSKTEKPAHVKCWSGGVVIYEGDSSGRVDVTSGGSVSFRDNSDGRIKELTSDCLIERY